jgi:hypothetical protein
MPIAELIEVAPAELTRRTNDVDWAAIEAKLSLRLPNDYKELISHYGEGTFGNYIHLSEIGADLKGFLKNISTTFAIVEEGRSKGRAQDWVDFPFYPTDKGFLPWAFDDNAGPLGWLTQGDCESWPIIVVDNEYSGYDRFDMTVTEFLTKWLKQEITVSFYPPDIYPFQPPYFVSEV